MKPLKSFLDYIDNGVVTDDFTRELDDTVDEVRKSKKWRKKIMTVEQLIKDEAYLARKAGVEEGLKIGREEGREEVLSAIRKSYSSGMITEEILNELLASINDDK